MRIIFFLSLVLLVICNAQSNTEIQLDITRNVSPPKNLPPYIVNIANKTSSKQLQNKDTITSGIYDITISQPGYKTQTITKHSITTSPFVIKTILVAKKRQISFECYDPRSPMSCGIDAYNSLELKTNTQVEFRSTFQPGQKAQFLLKFKAYKDIKITKTISPGEGPYIVPIKLERLTPLEFTIRKNTQIIDGTPYQYNFTVDGKPLEHHHIKTEKGIGRFYYTIMVDPNAKNFRAFIGHFYLERNMKKFRSGMSIGRPEYISVPLFIDHCNKFEKEEAIGIINKLLKGFRNRNMLKKCSPQELQKLIDYARTLSSNLEKKIMDACSK